MLGAGIALLLADRLDRDQRKAVSVTLALIGAVTPIPAILVVFAKSERTNRSALSGRCLGGEGWFQGALTRLNWPGSQTI